MSKQPKSTKEQIIEATRELLYERGNVTIKDISDKAYVNVAAINYHFGSKDKLIQIIIEEVIDALRNEILNIITEETAINIDVDKTMERLIDVIFGFAQKHTGIINYTILQMASQSETTNALINLFLVDNEFTTIILKQLAMIFPDMPEDQLFAKYLILFSSFIVPFFLNFHYDKLKKEQKLQEYDFFNQYKDYYINELKKLLTPPRN